MSDTFRPENECVDCGYTWHPRGKNRSLRCPACSQTNVIEIQPINTKTSDTGFSGASILVLVLMLFLLYGYFSRPNPVPPNATAQEESSTESPVDSEINSDLTVQVDENQVESHMDSLDETKEPIPSKRIPDEQLKFRETFYDWSRSEIKLRDKYTKLLNDPDSSSTELEKRRVEYLSLAEEKNKKCGDINVKLSSYLNSDVSRVRFEVTEIDIIKCHTQENLRASEKTETSKEVEAIESDVL